MKVLSTLQVRAIDGDTLRVGSERIRLRGIDTPEMSELDGPAAKRRLEELLRGGSIRIVPRGRDVYDRLVADVFVNEQNVAEILRSEGFLKAG
jgi:micrococcal nuclease